MSASTENHHSSLGKYILTSTGHIMKSHSLHFHALSVLFLLPIVFTLIVYPSFHLTLFYYPHYNFTQLKSHMNSLPTFDIIVFLILTVFIVPFFLCAVATITYSAVQVSYHRPINLVSSIKSIRQSFFPLLSTLIISHTFFVSIIFLFGMLLFSLVQILRSLGLKYDYNHFLVLILVIVPVLLWLKVNWYLAYVIAVVELKCGVKALRRSAYLMKGNRWMALLNMLTNELLMGLMVISGSMVLVIFDAAEDNQWRIFGLISQTLLYSVLGFLLMNYYLLGKVATYMYCKDFNGEKLPLEMRDKFAHASEHVSMPLDDEKNQAIV